MRTACLLAVCLVIPIFAGAQAPSAELVKELLARIDKLEKRVAELEGRVGGPAQPVAVAATPQAEPAPAAAPAAEAQAPRPAGEAHHMGMPEAGTYPNLKIAGFTDVNFAATDQRGTRSGFQLGQFILHMTSPLSPRVSFFGEMSFTARADAGTGSPAATGFNAEVERAVIRYDQSDYLKVSFGRYHTPINYWNTAFHHGQWLQTSANRPEMIQFGSRFMPVHFIGGLIEGAAPAGGLNLNYNVGLGNGRSSVISRGGDAGDVNNNRAWLVNGFIKPDRLYGLQVGASVYRDKITLPNGRDFGEWITSAHIVWNKENPEVIAEGTNIHHREVGRTHDFNSQAFYVQIAYRLPWFERLWKPYYRFEYIHMPRTDAVFAGLPNLAGSVLGVRYDISPFAAIKAEYRNQRRPGLARINGAFVQTSFTF